VPTGADLGRCTAPGTTCSGPGTTGTCTEGGACGACGGAGQVCCGTGQGPRWCSGSGTTCVYNAGAYTCQPCGGRDQRCCAPFVFGTDMQPGGSCTTPLVCQFSRLGGTCVDAPAGGVVLPGGAGGAAGSPAPTPPPPEPDPPRI
jgi:hypothetical protein